MPRLSSQLPKYRRHSNGKHAIVVLSGQTHYLGNYGSRASKREYDRLVAEWLLAGRELRVKPDDAGPTVVEMAAAYKRFAKKYYRKRGKATREYGCSVEALQVACQLYGRQPAAEFGPLALKAVRERMIQRGWSRGYINKQIGRVIRAFKWAASEELIPASIPQSLATVPGLRKGRSAAPERPSVTPVDDKIIESTLDRLPSVVADMVRFQRLTGCRPGEVCSLRPCDIQRDGEIWAYQLETHKTEHHEQTRVVFIGPRAQDVLRPYLLREEQAYCFSPAESEKKRRAAAHQMRRTPLSCGNRPGTNRKTRRRRPIGSCYTIDSYRRAVHRACDLAGVARWSPNRLRHSAATEIRKRFGLEAAQVVLGHQNANITQVYAERNLELALMVASQIG